MPREYIDFLKSINGGIPKFPFFELRKFDPEATNTNLYFKIDIFFEFKKLDQVYLSTVDVLSEYALFAIAEDTGGRLICCNQSGTVEAKIYYYDNDFGVLPLTKSLFDFFTKLIPESEVDYRKYGIDF